MRLSKTVTLVLSLLWLQFWYAPPVKAAGEGLPSIAFYYAAHVPVPELAQFDRIVVEPDHVGAAELSGLEAYGGRVHAYVSVGEAESWRDGYRDMDTDWFVGRNPGWNTDIADLSSADYREFLLSRRFQSLWERGFRAFFLDTLDSYQGIDQAKLDWQAQEQGLVALVRDLKARYPDAALLLNRGFPAIPHIKELVQGVVVESLFRAWNPRTGEYYSVSADDRKWLVKELVKARDEYDLTVYSIDYLPANQREAAHQTARQIAALGISPWVTVPEHDAIGTGVKEILPRRVLLIHDGESGRRDVEALAVVLDYFGYVPAYQDVGEPLPAYRLVNRYAGIVAWLYEKGAVEYEDWLERQVADGVRLVMLADPGLAEDSRVLKSFGLVRTEVVYPCRVVDHDKLYAFETRIDIAAEPLTDLRSTEPTNTIHVRALDTQGNPVTPVVTGPWGGLALEPWLRNGDALGTARWIIDPFAFIKTALALPEVPMPDVTTENGHRLWMSHIDGDGFLNRAELPGTPYAADVVRSRILQKYRLPTTVSIIEGEIGPTGLYPKQSPDLERIAREIFSLPTVELASHSYSHPFDWRSVEEGEAANAEYSLPIPGYHYSLDREITGSTAYIHSRLAPPGKRVKFFLWTGNCLPSENAIRITREAGLYNLNGGNTTIRNSHPFLSLVTPMIRPVGGEMQLYAPVMNENVYTNLWRGPFYGFRRVIETFERTEQPRRLKPINIYYHFYSGAKAASLRALEEVIDWTLSQQITPVHLSDYAKRVRAYQEATVARDLSGSLFYQAPAELRTLRQTGQVRTPVYGSVTNVAGHRRLQDGVYYALAGGIKTRLDRDPSVYPPVRLVRANGILESWRPNGQAVSFSIRGHQFLELVFDGPGPCRLIHGKQVLNGQHKKEGWQFSISRQNLEGAEVVCR